MLGLSKLVFASLLCGKQQLPPQQLLEEGQKQRPRPPPGPHPVGREIAVVVPAVVASRLLRAFLCLTFWDRTGPFCVDPLHAQSFRAFLCLTFWDRTGPFCVDPLHARSFLSSPLRQV